MDILFNGLNNICSFCIKSCIQFTPNFVACITTTIVWGWLEVGIETPPNEKLHFTYWLVPRGAFSSKFIEIESPSSEFFCFSYRGMVGMTMESSMVGIECVAMEFLRLHMSNILISLISSMLSWGFSFLVDFLVWLHAFPMTTMNNLQWKYNLQVCSTMNMDCLSIVNIGSLSLLNCDYRYFLNSQYRFLKLAQLWK